MNRVFLYDTSWQAFGGGEKFICAVADALAHTDDYEVSLLIDKPSVTTDKLSRYFNLSLQGVKTVAATPREVRARLTQADVAVLMSNFRPFGLPARFNVYILQIPYARISNTKAVMKALGGRPRESLKDLYRRRLMADAKRADLTLVYSEFVQRVLRQEHGIATEVLYPPIDDFSGSEEKEPMVLSVGRFFSGLYNDKRYDILIDAFKRFYDRLPGSPWQYHLVGSSSEDPASRQYIDDLRTRAAGYPIEFFVNSPYEELRRQYQRSTLFWHAAGYGVDERTHPERTEHFGMSTVEAMSAYSIPIVVNRGGQKEIVSQGKSGYLWDTPEQLVGFALALAQNPGTMERLRTGARQRFQDFTYDRFSRTLLMRINERAMTNYGKNI